MRHFLKGNGLSLVLGGLFLAFLVGHSVAGYFAYNHDQADHGQPQVSYGQYLTSGQFIETVGENWESEFLQMGMFVILTKRLYQKGSSESKDPDNPQGDEDADPREHQDDPDAPWPVRQGGLVLLLYEHSLSIAFLLLFLASVLIHAVGGMIEFNQHAIEHGKPAETFWQFLGSSEFWFQSFQNWQSEFLAMLCMVLFSVFLRERGSPQSKPVHASYAETTGD
jgi:hypothetical protein